MQSYPESGAGVYDGAPAESLTAAGFLHLLWPNVDNLGHHVNVWTAEGRKSQWFSVHNLDEAGATVEALATRKNVYIGTALIDLKTRKLQAEREQRDKVGKVNTGAIRGTADTAVAIPGVWLDLDIGGPIHGAAHKNAKLPPTREAALTLIDEALPLKPTLLIDSGHGVYAWWLFAEPWWFENDEEREDAADLVYRLQETIRAKAAAHGWDVDGTADLARLLRPIGAINRKLEPVPVRLIECDEHRRYQPDDFDHYLIDIAWRRIVAAPVDLADELPKIDLDLLQLPPWIKKLIRDGNEWDDEKNANRHGSRSQAQWRVVNEMMEAGLDDDTIAAVLLDARYRISDNPLEKGRRARSFVAREIGKAREHQKNKPPEPTIDFSGGGISPATTLAEMKNGHAPGTPSANGAAHQSTPINTVPEIDAGVLDLRIVTEQAWDAIKRSNDREPSLFRYGGAPVRIERDDEGRPMLRELTVDHVRHELARAAVFYTVKVTSTEGEDGEKKQSKSRKVVLPPSHVCRDILATRDQPLPIVTRVTECPVFATDGALQTTPGYHAGSRTYLAIPPDLTIAPVPTEPSNEERERARLLLVDDLLGDFPFVSPSDLANTVGLGLEPFIRAMIPGPLPLHGIEAPIPGSGKGLLADAITRPSCGRTVGAIAQAKDDDEWRKRITSMLERGFPVIQIDNVTRPLESGSLSMALTIPIWTDRILGQTRTISIPVRCSWIATANNPTYSTEMARRTVRTRIDPRTDRPQEREGWRHPELLAWVDEHRGELIWAFCVLVRAWVAAGQPTFSGKALGSYERWSHVVGGILEHAGIPGFLENQSDFYELADVEAAVWQAFVVKWWATFQDKEVGTTDLFPLALETDALDLGGGQERSQKTKFGRLLSGQRDRVIGGYRVTPSRTVQRAQMWRLLPTEGVNIVNVSEHSVSHPNARENPDLFTQNAIEPGAETFTDVHYVHTGACPGCGGPGRAGGRMCDACMGAPA